jgi:anti-repressor protein
MELQLIRNEKLDCSLSFIKVDDEIWFKGNIVAKAMGYKDTDDAIRQHVDEEDKNSARTLMPGKIPGITYQTKFINESGLYSLILASIK